MSSVTTKPKPMEIDTPARPQLPLTLAKPAAALGAALPPVRAPVAAPKNMEEGGGNDGDDFAEPARLISREALEAVGMRVDDKTFDERRSCPVLHYPHIGSRTLESMTVCMKEFAGKAAYDRGICSQDFKQYITRKAKSDTSISGKRKASAAMLSTAYTVAKAKQQAVDQAKKYNDKVLHVKRVSEKAKGDLEKLKTDKSAVEAGKYLEELEKDEYLQALMGIEPEQDD